jgi:hypothetical protein
MTENEQGENVRPARDRDGHQMLVTRISMSHNSSDAITYLLYMLLSHKL